MSGRTATQPRRQARPSRSAAGKSKQLSDDDEEDIAVEDDEEEEIDDEEERELLPPDPDHVAVRFTVGDTFEEDSIVTVTPEDSDSVPLAVTFQTKVLQCNTERSVVKLQYQVIDRQLYDAYANTVLRPGATLLSNDGTKCAKVVELDAEWHRGQPWAKNSEHLGKSVRWHVQGLGMRDGVVWGWLPREESDFTDDSGQAAPLWRIRFDPSQEATAAPADLEEFELQKALEMFRAKDARGAVGKDSGRKRSREVFLTFALTSAWLCACVLVCLCACVPVCLRADRLIGDGTSRPWLRNLRKPPGIAPWEQQAQLLRVRTRPRQARGQGRM